MDFIGKGRIFGLLSGLLVALSIVIVVSPGLKLGIDFTSGSSVTYRWAEAAPTTAQIRQVLIAAGHPEAVIQDLGEGEFFIRMSDLGAEGKEPVDEALTGLTGTTPETLDVTTVGRAVAEDTVRNAITAVVVASLFVMLYIMWAFRTVPQSYRYAITAVVTLLHDVLVTLGMFVVFGQAFNAEVNAIFIVGILTVIGYSVNDTIIVFDRIRENVRLAPGRSFRNNVNLSVNETIIRSLATSTTTLVVVVAMLLFGGATLRDFLLVLVVGIVAGSYSSIFVAASMLVAWHDRGLRGMLSFRRGRPAPAESA
jgi:preprotein translocase subunit SecF